MYDVFKPEQPVGLMDFVRRRAKGGLVFSRLGESMRAVLD